MRRYWPVIAVAALSVALVGSFKPNMGSSGSFARSESGGSHVFPGKSAVARTYVWRSSVSIPAAAADSGWGYTAGNMDTVFTDTDGTFMRYGAVRSTAADTLYYNVLGLYGSARAEDDATPSGFMTFLWYDLSQLPSVCRIDSAYIVVSCMDFGNITVNANGYIAARLDTVSADLAMLESESKYADPRYFNFSWNHVDADTDTPWSPTLANRDDWHDFGPRSDTVWDQSVTGGSAQPAQDAGLYRLEVTSSIQAFVDSGRDQNGPFVFYGVNTTSLYQSTGATTNYDNGQPYLIVHFTDGPRGKVKWGPSRVPLNWHFDDAVAAVEPHIAKLDSAGGKASLAIHADGVSGGAGGGTRWNASEINALLAQGHELVYHSNFHGDPSDFSLVGHADCDSLSFDINPDHAVDGLHAVLGASWQSPRVFAWPSHKLSAALVDSAIAYGFIGARGAGDGSASEGYAWSCSGVDTGEDASLLRWGTSSNLYAASIIGNVEDMVGTSASNPTAAQVVEEFYDLIDVAATAKAPMIFYVHTDKAGSTHTNAKIDADEFRWIINAATAHGGIELDTFGDIITEYRAYHVSLGGGLWGPQ